MVSPADPACMVVNLDHSALKVGRPVAGLDPTTVIRCVLVSICRNRTSSQPPCEWPCCKKSPPSHPPTAKSVDVCTPHTHTQHHWCSLLLRLSAIAALCHHSSLPSRLSALTALCPHGSLPCPLFLWHYCQWQERHGNVKECLPSACPSPAPVHSQECTFNPHAPPSPGFCLFLILCILQETARLSVCASQVQGSILRNFCRRVAYLCRVVSLRQ